MYFVYKLNDNSVMNNNNIRHFADRQHDNILYNLFLFIYLLDNILLISLLILYFSLSSLFSTLWYLNYSYFINVFIIVLFT